MLILGEDTFSKFRIFHSCLASSGFCFMQQLFPGIMSFFPFSFGFYLDDNLERAVLCLITALQLDLWTDKKFEQVTLNSNFGGSFGTSSVFFIWAFMLQRYSVSSSYLIDIILKYMYLLTGRSSTSSGTPNRTLIPHFVYLSKNLFNVSWLACIDKENNLTDT